MSETSNPMQVMDAMIIFLRAAKLLYLAPATRSPRNLTAYRMHMGLALLQTLTQTEPHPCAFGALTTQPTSERGG